MHVSDRFMSEKKGCVGECLFFPRPYTAQFQDRLFFPPEIPAQNFLPLFRCVMCCECRGNESRFETMMRTTNKWPGCWYWWLASATEERGRERAFSFLFKRYIKREKEKRIIKKNEARHRSFAVATAVDATRGSDGTYSIMVRCTSRETVRRWIMEARPGKDVN